jgi:hypothetical protein
MVPPTHTGATAVKEGTIFGFIVIVNEAFIAHCPAEGVNVYVVVVVLFKAGDHDPLILFKEVVGNATMLPPAQIELTPLNKGVILVAILTVFEIEQPLLLV